MIMRIGIACVGVAVFNSLLPLSTATTVTTSPIQVTVPGCLRVECEIALTRVATLRASGRTALEGPQPIAIQDRLGRFFVRIPRTSQIAVFDSNGRFLRTLTIGDPTTRSVSLVEGQSGSVLAWASPSQRAFAIDASLGVSPLPAASPYVPAFVLPDGTAVVAEQIQTRDLIGYPLHLLSADGRVLRSFGTDVPQYRSDLRLLMEYVAAPDSEGMVWSTPKGSYRLERWNPQTGKRLSQVKVTSTWFIESANYVADGRTKPKPVIEALREEHGLLWVLIRDVDAQWKPSTDAERTWTLQLYNSLHDWVLEAIDSNSGRVLATRRLATAHWARAPQPFVVSFSPNQAGGSADLVVWKPELRRRERSHD